MKRTLAAVVTYNRKELLLECLQALFCQSRQEFDILVVDNAGTDGTREALQAFLQETPHTGIRLIYRRLKKNIGGAGGFSYAVKTAAELQYEMVWLMDDDTIPEPFAYKELCSAAEYLDGAFAFLASEVLWTDGSPCIMNLTQKRTDHYRRQIPADSGIVPISAASFVSLLIPVAEAKKAGLPIRQFFLYGDDVEYTRRLGKNACGYQVMHSVVVHKLAENAGTDPVVCPEGKIDRSYYDSRNRFYMGKQEGVRGIAAYLYHQMRYLYRILTEAENHKKERVLTLLKGTLDGVFFSPEIERILL